MGVGVGGHREVKGGKKWNRSGFKREQGRDKAWQGRELMRGRKKNPIRQQRLVQIESKGKAEGRRADKNTSESSSYYDLTHPLRLRARALPWKTPLFSTPLGLDQVIVSSSSNFFAPLNVEETTWKGIFSAAAASDATGIISHLCVSG